MAEQPHESHDDLRKRSEGDERMDRIIGNLLRYGVLLSAVVVCAGGLLYLVREGRQPKPNLHDFHAEAEELRGPTGILRESAALHSHGLIMLGLLLLIATPVARVLFSTAAFTLQRDYLYVVFTLLVLAVLLYSLFHGYIADHD